MLLMNLTILSLSLIVICKLLVPEFILDCYKSKAKKKPKPGGKFIYYY